MKVIIVGAGIAGLTLANALQQADVKIDFLILEAKSTTDPQTGASLGLAPNGSRILDQLGCYKDLERLLEPVSSAGLHGPDGQPLLSDEGGRTTLFKLVSERTSYPVAFLERRSVLRVLSDHIRDRTRILTGKRVSRIEQDEEGATVICDDGTCFRGDVVVGADGVNSTIRREMWRTAEAALNVCMRENESEAMKAEYKCLFGISDPITGLDPGSMDVTSARDISTLTVTGKGGTVFWFLFGRMDKVYQANEIPRFTQQQASFFALENRELAIRPKGSIKLGQLWDSQRHTTMVALEEADYSAWTYGRIVCIGDSVHKMTPNSGAGGMTAIESAASLANSLYSIIIMNVKAAMPPSVPVHEIQRGLEEFEKRSKSRASATIKAAAQTTRLQAQKGLKERLATHVIRYAGGDYLINEMCQNWIGAPRVDFLPVPERSLKGVMPFNPSQGVGKQESRWIRFFIAMPLICMAVAAFKLMYDLVPYEEGMRILNSSVYRWGEDQDQQLQILRRFYRLPFLDNQAGPGALVTLPSQVGSHPPSWYQMFSFLADFGVWYAIMLIESARKANRLTVLRFALFWGMTNMHGIGIFVPLYYFFHYISTPISAFSAADMRLTDLPYTRTIMPAVLLIYSSTWADSYLSPVLAHRHIAAWLWRFSPLWICAMQWPLRRWFLTARNGKDINMCKANDHQQHAKEHLPLLRRTVICLSLISYATWTYTTWSRCCSLADIFIPTLSSTPRTLSFEVALAELLKWDQVFFGLGNIYWVVLFMWDLKAAGMVQLSWPLLLVCPVVLSLLAGNGAMLGLMWLYRETVLATKHHKDVVVSPDPVVHVKRADGKVLSGEEKGLRCGKARCVRFSVSREEDLWN